MGLNKDGYYSLREILGYNAKVNVVLSDRGRGKSYGTKLFLMEQTGEFMCLYRTGPDMSTAIGTWLDTLYENGYQPEQFEWDGDDKSGYSLLYNGAVKGYFRALSQVNHIKQEKFPDTLNWLWLDEFIPLVYKKLPGVNSEGDAIRAIMKTIEHDTIRSREEKGLKPLRVLMYANPFTWNNPILSYFRIVPKGYGIWRVGPDIVCEMLAPYDGPKKNKKMTMDEFLGDEVNKNQGWNEQNAFVVETWGKNMIPEGSVRFGDNYYTIYKKDSNRRYYIRKTERHCNAGYCYGTLAGLQERELCIDKVPFLQTLRKMSYAGNVWYYDINCKFDWLRDITS